MAKTQNAPPNQPTNSAAALGWAGDVDAAHAAAAAAAAAASVPPPTQRPKGGLLAAFGSKRGGGGGNKNNNNGKGKEKKGGGGIMAAFVTRNWPPRCLELVAPNSTVLDQGVLDHVTQVGVGGWGMGDGGVVVSVLCTHTHPYTHTRTHTHARTIQALGVWGARLDKGKLRSVINALDQYYAQRGALLVWYVFITRQPNTHLDWKKHAHTHTQITTINPTTTTKSNDECMPTNADNRLHRLPRAHGLRARQRHRGA